VILEPAAVVGIGIFLAGALDRREADEGRSAFSKPGGGNRVGEKLFGENVTLRSDPRDVALAGQPFDPEGVPLAPTTWVDRGKLAALPVSRYWAKKSNVPATGQPGTFILDGGSTPRAELLKGVKRGVLITRFFYTGMVDPQTVLVTGLTRDGVFLVENGEVVAPVNNFRWNQSVLTMLANTDAMSPAEVAPTDFGAFMRAPALRTHDFNLASVSDAV
jgi:predicted Zn-dependent protease